MLFCSSFCPKCDPNWNDHGYQTNTILKLGSFCITPPEEHFETEEEDSYPFDHKTPMLNFLHSFLY